MRIFFLFNCLLALTPTAKAQSYQCLDTIKPNQDYSNIYNRTLYSDSLSSSFMICIKLEVKAHKHAQHTEQVLVLEGTGNMQLGDKIIGIKKGDLIAIPKNTWHGVKNTSPDGKPLKVISFQSPLFDGKDRIMKPEN